MFYGSNQQEKINNGIGKNKQTYDSHKHLSILNERNEVTMNVYQNQSLKMSSPQHETQSPDTNSNL